MANKMTISEKFLAVRAILENEGKADLVAFIDERIAQHNKKAGNKKPTNAQLRSIEIADAVYADMEIGKQYTVTDMMKSLPAFAEVEDLTQSYANSIVKRLKDSGRVTRTEVKGRPYFEKVVED